MRTLYHRELPSHVPTVDELYARCDADFDLSLDMADPHAIEAVVDSASSHGEVDAVNVIHHRLGGPVVAAAHQRGLLAFVWGVRRRGGMERALRRGAHGILADDVAAPVAAVQAAQARPDPSSTAQ